MLFDSLVLGSDQPMRRFSRDAPPTPHGKRADPPRPVGHTIRYSVHSAVWEGRGLMILWYGRSGGSLVMYTIAIIWQIETMI